MAKHRSHERSRALDHRQGATVGIGLPSFNGAAYVEQAISSLRAQTYGDFVVACTDDASTDGTPDILERHAVEDPRIHVRRSTVRRGMVDNWIAAYRFARELSPSMRYFAWASDHDLWQPRWLALLVAELDAHPEASLVYPLDVAITADGEAFRPPWRFDTAGMTHVRRRFVSATVGVKPGSAVYGLHRAELVERCGVFYPAVFPDRVLIEQLAMIGEFRQVDEVLWHRRYFSRTESIRTRQMRVLFRSPRPLVTRLPFPLAHCALLTWFVLARGSTRPEVGRARAMFLVLWYTAWISWVTSRRFLRNRLRRWRPARVDATGS
jgi:glycosyltransferase involved in cell wall biosynthesis